MRLNVYNEWRQKLIPSTIIWNLAGLYIIYSFVLYFPEGQDATVAIVLTIAGLLTLNALLFGIYLTVASLVILEENAIKCIFFNRLRRCIPFKEVKDYGVFWEKGLQYVYVSRYVLSEYDTNRAFELYKKTKDVIVFQHNEEALKFLREHIVLQQRGC